MTAQALCIIIAVSLIGCSSLRSNDPSVVARVERHGIVYCNIYMADESISEYRDAVELDPKTKEVFAQIDAEVEAALVDNSHRGKIGFVHTFWAEKKKILKQKYKITWRSPGELNPLISYD